MLKQCVKTFVNSNNIVYGHLTDHIIENWMLSNISRFCCSITTCR